MRGHPRTAGATLAIAAATALLVATCTGDGGKDGGLPPFVHPEPDGSVRVDVEAASDGAATLDEWNNVILKHGENELGFSFSGMSSTGILSLPGQGRRSLKEPPLLISPVLTPGDGVIDFFAAVEKEDRGPGLHYHLFLDTDW
jgi:hypothetical protein